MKNGRAHLGMIVYTLIIAGSFPVVSAITPNLDSTVLTFWRFLSATLVFALMLPFLKGARRRPGLRDLGRYAVVGGSYGFFFILMFEALKTTSPINTSTIYTTLPLMTALLGGMTGEPVRLRQLGILGLSMAAALWVVFRGDWERMAALEFSRGDLLFFLLRKYLDTRYFLHGVGERIEENITQPPVKSPDTGFGKQFGLKLEFQLQDTVDILIGNIDMDGEWIGHAALENVPVRIWGLLNAAVSRKRYIY
jgi:hypothetical protein